MIERFLAKLNFDVHGDSDLAIRIRHEIRVLRWLMLATGLAMLVTFVIIASACVPSRRPALDDGSSSQRPEVDPLLLEIPDLRAAPEIRVWLRSLADQEKVPVILPRDNILALGYPGLAPEVAEGELSRLGDRVHLELAMPAGKSWELNAPTITLMNLTPSLSLGGHNYQGRLEISVQDKQLQIVNTVTLEEYTLGSVGWEALPSWHIEALKAQAVAIRTYTLFTLYHARAEGWHENWDVDDTTRFLRYGGLGETGAALAHANANVIRAVRETDGEVMLWRGKIFKAFFSSNSGGHSASVFTSFGLKAIPPLGGAALGEFGKSSSLYRWTRRHDASKLVNQLSKRGKDVGTIRAINVEGNDPSGFAERVVVVGSERAVTLKALDFRNLIGTGPRGLPSTNFSAQVEGDELVFTGKGWGHGVGLDQWAAQDMAEAGVGYREILHRHYPESTITRPWLGN